VEGELMSSPNTSGTLAPMSPEKTKSNPLGAGRNPRAGAAANEKLTIRLTTKERADYELAAGREDVSLGEWIRAACAAQLKRKVRR
jgi:hypothetical protein